MKIIEPKNERSNKLSDEFLHINSCSIATLSKANPKRDFIKIYRPHGRKDYQIIVVTQGELDVIINGEVHTLKENDICIFPPDVTNEYIFKTDRKGVPTTIFYIHFIGTAVSEIMKELEIFSTTILKSADPTIKDKFRMVIKLNQGKEKFAAIGMLLQILSAFQNNGADAVGDNNCRIRDVIGYIALHYADNIDIDSLAKYCKMSPSRFSHAFKEKHGVSPYNYILKLRLEQAAQLLKRSLLNINEISSQVGFRDPYYFTRIFGKYYGLSPSKYRAENYNRKEEEG